MSKTLTMFVDFQRLHSCGNSASLIIRLMMAYNDISLANQCLSKFKEKHSPIRKHIQQGAGMYFVRLQCGHLNEAMKIIQEIRNDQNLSHKVKRCSQAAQDSFNKLVKCLKGGPDYKKFKKYVGKIRHTTVFHYDPVLVDRALWNRANGAKGNLSSITGGSDLSLCRFELADHIIDSIVCRLIWKIPQGADIRKEADLAADYGSDLCQSFITFSGEFISRYIREHAAI